MVRSAHWHHNLLKCQMNLQQFVKHLSFAGVNSRVFARKILREFYTKKIDKKLPLYQIFTHGNSKPSFGRDTLIAMAIPSLNKALRFETCIV